MEEEKQKFDKDQDGFMKLLELLGNNPQIFESLKDLDKAKEKFQQAGKVWSGYEQVKTHAELLNWAVRTRFGTLPTVSALAATLLVVATFNDKLIVLDDFVRVLLSVLLILVPSSLWGLFYEAIKAEDESFNKIYELTEKNIGKEAALKIKEGRKSSFRGMMPLISNIAFSITVLLIIYLIWRG